MNDNALKMYVPENDKAEFFGQLIDMVEDFLTDYDLTLPRSEKDKKEDGVESDTIIYGNDYDELLERFSEVCERWEMQKKDESLQVNTPAGPITAKIIPDEEYPGIIVSNANEAGSPCVILEYSPSAFGNTKSCMETMVYDLENPLDDPTVICQMGKDLRDEKSRTVTRWFRTTETSAEKAEQ